MRFTRLIRLLALALTTLFALQACGKQAGDQSSAPQSDATREVDWLELMPADELDALQNAPPVVHDGNFKALQTGSSKTVPEMDGLNIRIPGYIVPIESDDQGQLSEFFLVPYFGACIHVPPPPPNQIIYAKTEPSIAMTDIYAAYWVEGKLHARQFEDETAATAYSLDVSAVSLWE